MSKKIIGITVGTTMNPEKYGTGGELLNQIAKNTEDILAFLEQESSMPEWIEEIAALVGGDA